VAEGGTRRLIHGLTNTVLRELYRSVVTKRELSNTAQRLSFLVGFAPIITYGGGGQLAARGPHVACQSGFGGPRKHSEKSSNFKFEDVKLITVNVSVEANLNRDLLLFSVD